MLHLVILSNYLNHRVNMWASSYFLQDWLENFGRLRSIFFITTGSVFWTPNLLVPQTLVQKFKLAGAKSMRARRGLEVPIYSLRSLWTAPKISPIRKMKKKITRLARRYLPLQKSIAIFNIQHRCTNIFTSAKHWSCILKQRPHKKNCLKCDSVIKKSSVINLECLVQRWFK